MVVPLLAFPSEALTIRSLASLGSTNKTMCAQNYYVGTEGLSLLFPAHGSAEAAIYAPKVKVEPPLLLLKSAARGRA
jgi:hypothetical protein